MLHSHKFKKLHISSVTLSKVGYSNIERMSFYKPHIIVQIR